MMVSLVLWAGGCSFINDVQLQQGLSTHKCWTTKSYLLLLEEATHSVYGVGRSRQHNNTSTNQPTNQPRSRMTTGCYEDFIFMRGMRAFIFLLRSFSSNLRC